ncbi:MAG: hypothetical protein ACOYL5_17775 [Phototrophicaceae bacterium]
MQPLRITAELSTPVGAGMGMHFDAILSYAIIERASQGQNYPPEMYPFVIPLPLEVLWQPNGGLPLWASTNLAPMGDATYEIGYINKRALDAGRHTRENLNTGKGRHKDMHRPFKQTVALGWQADVIGHAESIADLLATVHAIGKKRTAGGGRVHQWKIDTLPNFRLLNDAHVYRRPVPIEAIWDLIHKGVGDTVVAPAQRLGYSPPYWYAPAHLPCVGG